MPNSSSPYSTLILIALMVAAFYFLIIRPNKKRQQAQIATMNSLTAGTRVLLTSGLFGTLVEVGQKQAVIELSPGVHLTVLKQAIARAVRPGDEDGDTDDDEAVAVEDDFDSPPVGPFRAADLRSDPTPDASTTGSSTTGGGTTGGSAANSGSTGSGAHAASDDTAGYGSSTFPVSDSDPRSGTNPTSPKD